MVSNISHYSDLITEHFSGNIVASGRGNRIAVEVLLKAPFSRRPNSTMIVRTVVFNNKSADRFSKASSASSRCPCSRQVNIIPSPRCRPIEGRILPNWGIDISSLAEKEAAQQRPCSLVLVFVDLIHQGYISCGLRIDTDPVVFQKEKIDLAMAKAFHIPGVSRRGLPRHVLYS